MCEDLGAINLELAQEVAKEAVKEIEKDRSFAWELIANARRDSKRWFIAFLVCNVIWCFTFCFYVWLPDEETTIEYITESHDEGNSIINGTGEVSINGKGDRKEID